MQELGRIMALDVGDVRTGVAMSDPLQTIASPHGVLQDDASGTVLAKVVQLVRDYEPICIVAGLPLTKQGETGPQAQKVQAFVETLRQQVAVPVVFEDERFSTAAAERMLISADMRRKKRKQVVDKIAATHILQLHLDRRAFQRARESRPE